MSAPPLYKFLVQNLGDGIKVPLRPDGKANHLVVDGISLMSILYPPTLDWILPPWKELQNRVKLFVQRLTDAGFQLVVFFTASKNEQQNVEAKKHLVSERSKFVQYVLRAIETGTRLPEDVYYTPIRLIKLALLKAFQSCKGVKVFVTDIETSKAISVYCAGKDEIFAFLGTDLSESLVLPIPALCSVHMSIFDWESFWKGALPDVRIIKRAEVSQALVPQSALPVFATLVGNPLFPRDRLQGFFTNESHADEIFTTAQKFIQTVIQGNPEATFEDFANEVYANLTAVIDYDAFLTDFTRSCLAYTLNKDDKLTEVPFETVQRSRFYFFEPGYEQSDAVPAILLLRPLRLRALHLKFGAMTFAEVWAQPGGLCSTDYLSLPASSQTEQEVLQKPLLERLQLFETLSNVELDPIMVFNENYELSQLAINESWLYLTLACMSQLEGRAAFTCRGELQLLVAQFVCLQDVETHVLTQGALTLELASLSHLFHSTLSHLSKLNAVCGFPFKPYNEWEIFDGVIAALDLSSILALPSFVKNKERYERLVAMIESSLAHPLRDEPMRPPSDTQRTRPRPYIMPAAHLRVTPLSLEPGVMDSAQPTPTKGSTRTSPNGLSLNNVTNPILLDSAIKAMSPHIEPKQKRTNAFFSDPSLASRPLPEDAWPDLTASRSPNLKPTRPMEKKSGESPKMKPLDSLTSQTAKAPGLNGKGGMPFNPKVDSKEEPLPKRTWRLEVELEEKAATPGARMKTTPKKWVPRASCE